MSEHKLSGMRANQLFQKIEDDTVHGIKIPQVAEQDVLITTGGTRYKFEIVLGDGKSGMLCD